MTTLNTRSTTLDPILDMEQFLQIAMSFDHYYAFSDDHRVYLAGRRAEDRIEAYAEKHSTARRVWKLICDAHSEKFFASQLMSRVEAILFAEDKDGVMDAVKLLEDYCIPYLANLGHKTLIGRSVRDAIAKHIGAPPIYSYGAQYEERERMIEEHIANYERKGK